MDNRHTLRLADRRIGSRRKDTHVADGGCHRLHAIVEKQRNLPEIGRNITAQAAQWVVALPNCGCAK
jgi:hypothetical protein